MTFTRRWSDDVVLVDQPWERFAVMDEDVLQHIPLGDMKRRSDGMAVEVMFRCANGSATYRRVGRDPQRKVLIWELIEGEYREPGS